MSTLLSIRTRRRLNGTIVTVSATISVPVTDQSPDVVGNPVSQLFEPLSFEERLSCLEDLEDALVGTIEQYI